MKVSERMIAAKAIITDPLKWTQGYYARDNAGEITEAETTEAVCFCSIGALHRVGEFNWHSEDTDPAEVYLNGATDNNWIVEYNDTHTHEEVMQVWDKAIAEALADEQALEVEA